MTTFMSFMSNQVTTEKTGLGAANKQQYIIDSSKKSVEETLDNTGLEESKTQKKDVIGLDNPEKTLYDSLESIGIIVFTEKTRVNSRIIMSLGHYGINTIGELSLMDIDDFGNRYGVGKTMIKHIENIKDNLIIK